MLPPILLKSLSLHIHRSFCKHARPNISHQRRSYSSGILSHASRTVFYALIIGATVSATGYLGYLLLSDLFSWNPLSTTHLITQSLSHIQEDEVVKNALGIVKDAEKELSVYGSEGARHRRRPAMLYRRAENDAYEIGEMTFFVENRDKGIKAVVGVQAVKSNIDNNKDAIVEIRRLWIDIPGRFHKELVRPVAKPTRSTSRNPFNLLFGKQE